MLWKNYDNKYIACDATVFAKKPDQKQ